MLSEYDYHHWQWDRTFSACKEDCINLACQNSEWVLDSGVSYHTTPKKNFFTFLQEGSHDSIKMDNKDSPQILGAGEIYSTTNTRMKIFHKFLGYVISISLQIHVLYKFFSTWRDYKLSCNNNCFLI